MDTLKDRLLDLQLKAHRLKLKLGSTDDDIDRLALLRNIIPDSEVIVDVNEGWTIDKLENLMPALLQHSVKMVEQPLKAGDDHHLRSFKSPIPIFADESFHTTSQIESISKLYSGVNIKLDKIGGLTEALKAIDLARQHNLGIMVGCLGGTSLSSAVGCVAAQKADFVDLDNHLWLKKDHPQSLGGFNGHMALPSADLWG
jgi:L-alanine-DL-glutamate epimerase-like enolase superfamily enzyme